MTLPVVEPVRKTKGLTKRMKDFAVHISQGMGDAEAAIAVGVSMWSAPTQAWRWKNHPDVKKFLNDLYMSELNYHKEAIRNVINVWRKILNSPTSSDKNKIEAGRAMMEFYKSQVDADILKLLTATDEQDTANFKTLVEYMQNPLPVRTLADFN